MWDGKSDGGRMEADGSTGGVDVGRLLKPGGGGILWVFM